MLRPPTFVLSDRESLQINGPDQGAGSEPEACGLLGVVGQIDSARWRTSFGGDIQWQVSTIAKPSKSKSNDLVDALSVSPLRPAAMALRQSSCSDFVNRYLASVSDLVGALAIVVAVAL